ncbi:MAG: ubiquinone/menaquinone biosynthesis methyltransferase [Comamonas sp.]
MHNKPTHNAAAFEPAADDVFARIAGRYDTLCDIFSLYLHRRWKARMAQCIAQAPGSLLLDVASGTGDIPLRVLRRWRAGGATTERHIIVSDLSPAMLAVAHRKLGENAVVDYRVLNAYSLDGIADNSVDAFSISFGMKIMDRDQVVRQALRVLKPGGLFFCLEASHIRWQALHRAYLHYMRWCLPMIAKLKGDQDTSTYRYFLKGIEEFPDQAALALELKAAGLRNVHWENMTLGIVALHMAKKP